MSFLPSLLPKPSEANNIHHEYILLLPKRYVSRPIVQNIGPKPFSSINAKQILINNFNQKKDAASAFLPKLIASTTQTAIKIFQSHPAKLRSNVEHICISYDFFILIF